MEFPKELRYTEEHEWLLVEGEVARVGITDYAQSELGDIVFLELPEVGTEVEAGSVFGTIEAVKTVSDLYAPVAGVVTEVNTDLIDQPELVNQSPYSDGWMLTIKFRDADELELLLDAAAYREHVGEE